MLRTGFDIIAECTKAENCETASVNDTNLMDELSELYDECDENGIEELADYEESALRFTPEMVPVMESSPGRYIVELDMLAKCANSVGMTIPNTLYEVAEACSINANNITVVIESNEECGEYCEAGKAEKKAKLKSFRTALKDLKNHKIAVKKKGSRFNAANPFKSKKNK